MVDSSLGKHGVVLELRLAEGRGVASNEDELGLAGAKSLEGRLVAESDLAGLHDKCQAGGQVVGGSLVLVGSHCVGVLVVVLPEERIRWS